MKAEDGSKIFGAGVGQENRASFGGRHRKDQFQQPPLKRFQIAYRVDLKPDLKQRAEVSRRARGRRQISLPFQSVKIERVFAAEEDCRLQGRIIFGESHETGSRARVRVRLFVANEQQDRTAGLDQIAVRDRLLLDRYAVDEGSVEASQIVQVEYVPFSGDAAMLPRKQRIGDADRIGRPAADGDIGVGDGEDRSFQGSRDGDQFGNHRIVAPDQRLNSALIFGRECQRDQASTLCSQYRLQSKLIISQSLLIVRYQN